MTPIEVLKSVYEVQEMGTFLMVSEGGKNEVIADFMNGDFVLRPDWLERAKALDETAPAEKPAGKSKRAAADE